MGEGARARVLERHSVDAEAAQAGGACSRRRPGASAEQRSMVLGIFGGLLLVVALLLLVPVLVLLAQVVAARLRAWRAMVDACRPSSPC